jgi:5-methyltetrahydropteroyltriglutamate--homocysteine methyltransferase
MDERSARTPPRRPARAEVVGSLLRPMALRAAIERFYAPGHHAVLTEERAGDRRELAALEDEAITEVVRRQEQLGLDVVTDGEFRRWMFLDSFYDAVEGVSTDRNEIAMRNAAGREVRLNVHSVESRLRKMDSPAAREAAFLARIATRPFKVTFPAASLFAHPLGVDPGVYSDPAEFLAHAIAIERELIAEAIAAGCRYVQLDFPLYPYLTDEAMAARFRGAGHDLDALLETAIRADTEIVAGIPPHVTTALHVCRGNYRSSWLLEGALDPVAERVFGELPYDAFLVEWDDVARQGGYEAIRYTRRESVMVMGLVSSKTRELEGEDEVLRRLETASRLLPWEQLALSPQCGFASTLPGNEIDEERQWRKLELVARVAERVWG